MKALLSECSLSLSDSQLDPLFYFYHDDWVCDVDSAFEEFLENFSRKQSEREKGRKASNSARGCQDDVFKSGMQ